MSDLKNVMAKPLHAVPNDQNTYHFMQEIITILVSGEDTNGAFSWQATRYGSGEVLWNR